MRLAVRKPVLLSRVGTFLAGLVIAVPLAVCGPAAQEQENERQRAVREIPSSRRLPEPSDLARENLNHLAASAAQVKEVLLKDAGLLVELKRLAIKEATDSGQIVEDSSLTDQAIFDRLERDIVFRSVATRLVQKYGYLLPSFNSDSELGKERELILKERAKRQVQVEAQEDAEVDAEIKKVASGEGSQNCGHGQQASCSEAAPSRTRRDLRLPNGGQGQAPDRTTPNILQNPSMSGSQILRASGGSTDSGMGGTQDAGTVLQQLGNVQGDRGGYGQGVAEDGGTESRSSRIAQMMAASQGSGVGGTGTGLALPLDLGNMAGDSASYTDRNRSMGSSARANMNDRVDWSRELRRRAPVEDLSPVSMVRRPNPYADVPSLYDMYVQASARQRPLERFGLEVFRNENADPDEFPMDLPAGADYVVGPGDGLAIDLWGGVSQRISRTVDR